MNFFLGHGVGGFYPKVASFEIVCMFHCWILAHVLINLPNMKLNLSLQNCGESRSCILII